MAKQLKMYCKQCNTTKTVLLVEENVPSKNLGIWPFYTFPHTYCYKCEEVVSTTLEGTE